MSSAALPSTSPARWRTVTLTALVVAAVLRLWYLSIRLDHDRWFDERINLRNVVALVTGASDEPLNRWYGPLSYRPQVLLLRAVDAAHRGLGLPALQVVEGDGYLGLTPLAFLLCRLLPWLYGLAALVLLWRLARRQWGERAAALATLVFAASPWQVHASAVFKPDGLLLLFAVATLAATRRLIEDPRPRTHALAGALVGLAASTKLNGVLLGLLLVPPLVLDRRRRRLVGSALATLVAAAVVAALDDVAEIGRYFAANLEHYAAKATGGPLAVLRAVTVDLAGSQFLGPAIGLLALAGGVVLARRGWRRRDTADGVFALTLVIFPFLFVAAFVAVSDRAKENHLLPLLPVAALAAGVAADRLWTRLATARRGRALRTAGLAALVAWATVTPFRYVLANVPSTYYLAGQALARRMDGVPWQQIVAVEVDDDAREAAVGALRQAAPLPLLATADLATLGSARLDRVAFALFPARRLDEGGIHRRRAQLPGARLESLDCRLPWVRGPRLVLLHHPPEVHSTVAAERRLTLADPDRELAVPLPPRRATLVAIWARRTRRPLSVDCGGERRELLEMGRRGVRVTEWMPWPDAAACRLRLDDARREPLRLEVRVLAGDEARAP